MNVVRGKSGRGVLLQILVALTVCLFCVCAQMQNDDVRETEIEQEVENKYENKNEDEIENESESGNLP